MAIRNRAWAAAASSVPFVRSAVPAPALAAAIIPLLLAGADAGRIEARLQECITAARLAARRRQLRIELCRARGTRPKASPIQDVYRYALALLKATALRELQPSTVQAESVPIVAARRWHRATRRREASPVYVRRPTPTRPAPPKSQTPEARRAMILDQLQLLGVKLAAHRKKRAP